jgi:hypothetical protein
MSKITTAQLVARYNKAAAALGREPVNKFASRAVAEKRVAVIEAEIAPKAYDPDSLGEKRGLRFDLPGSKKKVPPREGTSRAKLLGMLQDAGAKRIDFEDLHKACGFKNRKSTRDAIGLLSRRNGYAIAGTDASVRLAK